MSNTNENSVSLFIDGKFHNTWEAYEVDSDLLTPADAWYVSLKDAGREKLPAEVTAGASVEIRVGNDRVMVGRIDDVNHEVSKAGQRFQIAGRDSAAALLDCSSKIFSAQMVSLSEAVEKIVADFGIRKTRIDSDLVRVREKIQVNPGATAWNTLQEVAAANGLFPWFEPDGTLVVGGPDYDQEPVATLVIRKSGQGNNVLRLSTKRSMSRRYSSVTVLGQHRGNDRKQGEHQLKATEIDNGVTWHRPLIVQDSEAESEAMCRSRAIKILTDSRLTGFTLIAEVAGHRISAPGQSGNGLLWKPGQRVHVISEPHDLDTTLFLTARTFTGRRDQGPITRLTLKEDRTWGMDAYQRKNKHRYKKHSAPLQIPDLSKPFFTQSLDIHLDLKLPR